MGAGDTREGLSRRLERGTSCLDFVGQETMCITSVGGRSVYALLLLVNE